MYEQPEPGTLVFRRILWIVLGFIAILAVVWTLIWFFFVKGHTDDVAQTKEKLTSHAKDEKNKSNDAKSDASDKQVANNNDTTQSNPSAVTPAPQTNGAVSGQPGPTRLADAGAEHVFLPVVFAVVAGTSISYVRVLRKSTS